MLAVMRQQVHELPSFARYLNKVFQFRSAVARLTDARRDPGISPASVFLAVFHGFVFRLRSFRQLERELAQPALLNWIGAGRAFGDDVLRYSLAGFDLDGLNQILTGVNRTLKRNKAFDAGRVQGHIVAALDGVEVLSSYSRHCDCCLERRVTVRKGGVKTEQIQYYHRAVGCQIVGGPVKAFLALEWLRPGEGEDTAALRLLRGLPERYGSKLFDILLLDALYAQAPVFQLARQKGWDLVVSLKQNQRDLYQSAVRLFARRPANSSGAEKLGGRRYSFQLWDTEGLPFSGDYPEPVRVVRSEESVTQNHYRRGELAAETTEHEWLWITTLPTKAFPAAVVRTLGHDRWEIENNGWNDLTQNWAFKHGFLHACRHRPASVSSSESEASTPDAAPGETAGLPTVALAKADDQAPSLVDNRGLAAVTLILLIAFTLTSAFIHCHSKLVRRHKIETIEVAAQLRRSVTKLPPRIRSPDSPAPLPNNA